MILLRRDTSETSATLLSAFDTDKVLWRAAISVHKYGVIYLANRLESRMAFLPAITAEPIRFAVIASFLSHDNNAIGAINYGVYRWVTASPEMQVEFRIKLTPPNAIASLGQNMIAVRAKDFGGDAMDRLDDRKVLWDLHDFAHQACSALCPELYGNKYFPDLASLAPRLTALIRSPGMNTSDPRPRCSDGVVFSQFLTELYTEAVDSDMVKCSSDKNSARTYASLTHHLAIPIADYLLARRALRHPTSNTWIQMESPISPEALSVLAQNKSYELTASEIEQRVFTRGGPTGDARDELDGLDAAGRVVRLASSRNWMYFEVRNTIKHRAHKMAYLEVVERMLGKDGGFHELGEEDVQLLRATRDNLEYRGWDSKEAGSRVINLWQKLASDQQSRRVTK